MVTHQLERNLNKIRRTCWPRKMVLALAFCRSLVERHGNSEPNNVASANEDNLFGKIISFHKKTNSSEDLKANLTRPQLCSRPWILNKSLCIFLGINMQGDILKKEQGAFAKTIMGPL